MNCLASRCPRVPICHPPFLQDLCTSQFSLLHICRMVDNRGLQNHRHYYMEGSDLCSLTNDTICLTLQRVCNLMDWALIQRFAG
jgi:hypothetical protein